MSDQGLAKSLIEMYSKRLKNIEDKYNSIQGTDKELEDTLYGRKDEIIKLINLLNIYA